MFNLNDSMRYWLYPQPTDMRKGFYTLSGLVTDHMGQNVRSGDVFIFLNRHCTGLKALHMEHGGLVILSLSNRLMMQENKENPCQRMIDFEGIDLLPEEKELAEAAETEQISKHFLEDLERLTSLSAEVTAMEY